MASSPPGPLSFSRRGGIKIFPEGAQPLRASPGEGVPVVSSETEISIKGQNGNRGIVPEVAAAPGMNNSKKKMEWN